MSKDYQVAVYYFPNYHPDPRNALVHGPGWTEWELVRRAEPRFPGHYQPRQPLWGYEDESNPEVMSRKIDAAADHAIDAFLFDWYWYNDGPFLQRGLENGFMQAANNQRLKFAIHWANHDWTNIHPVRLAECLPGGSPPVLYPGRVSEKTFKTVVDYAIQRYFCHPSYWKVDGAPYFSFYDLSSLVRSLNGVEGVKQAFAYFRQKTKDAGFPDLHLNQVLWDQSILPGEQALRQPGELLELLGLDSFTSYVWIHHVPLDSFPQMDYQAVFCRYLEYWEKAETEIALPYFPNATMGWDSSPRTIQSEVYSNAAYPFTACLVKNTPESFKESLREIKQRMSQKGRPRVLTINAWNEWTEGSYLEPDLRYGMGYLEAIREVFG